VRKRGDQKERPEQAEEELSLRCPVRSVDPRLRADDAEGRRPLLLQRPGDEHAVARRADLRRTRPARRDADGRMPRKPRDDIAAANQDDPVGALETRAPLQAMNELRVEWHP